MTDHRAKFRVGLLPVYLPIYDGLMMALPPEWAPYYGVRTFSEQTALFEIGRKLPGKIVTNADAGQSPHNWGCASDWTLWDSKGNPIWLKAGDSRWEPYLSAVKLHGGRPGAEFSNVDYPHNELPISVSWSKVLTVFLEKGIFAAQDFIKASML